MSRHPIDREAAARAVDQFLRALGRDPEGDADLRGTGRRVAEAWADELLAGYGVDVGRLLEASAFAGSSDVVAARDVPVTTMCPHHLLPARGRATIVYAPGGRLVGVGTLVTLVEAYARRLELQERIGEYVVAALGEHLAPRWSACRLVLEHACMTARGEKAHGAKVETIAFSGAPHDKGAAYALLVAGSRDGG